MKTFKTFLTEVSWLEIARNMGKHGPKMPAVANYKKYRAIIQKRSTTPEQLHDVVTNREKYPYVDAGSLVKILNQRQILPETLDHLADHPNPKIAEYVAMHSRTTPETLDRLGDHPQESVRAAVVRSRVTLPSTLSKIARRGYELTASGSTKTNLGKNLTENPNIHPDDMDHLANFTLDKLADTTNISPQARPRAESNLFYILNGISTKRNVHPKTISKILDRLQSDDGFEWPENNKYRVDRIRSIESGAARNPATDEKYLENIGNKYLDAYENAKDYAEGSNYKLVLRDLARNLKTPESVMNRYANSKDETIRYFASPEFRKHNTL